MSARWDDLVLVGRIARTHGHRGAVIVNPDTDFPETRFVEGAIVWMLRGGEAVPVRLLDAWFHQGRPVLTLDGVATMNDAEALRGAELRVPEHELQPLPEGAYYQFQLVGCEVVTSEGRRVGTIASIEGEPGNHRLSIDSDGGEVLVPLGAPIFEEIDLARRRVVIDPPDGLLDVNRPASRGGEQ